MLTFLQSIPMGTVMTACLLLGAIGVALSGILPRAIIGLLSAMLFAAGAWNAGWHGLRHLNDFWGQMGLASGVVMLIAATFCARSLAGNAESKTPSAILALLALLLAGFGGYYAWTIYNL